MRTPEKLLQAWAMPIVSDSTRGGVAAQAFWIVFFSALTAVGARVEIPHEPVPYTLQTFFVLLAGAFLGMRNGSLSQFAYLAAGAAGAPVFAGGDAGLARLFGPSGGYLFAFPVAAFLVGWLVQQRRGLVWTLFSMAVGLLVIFVFGTVQLNVVYLHDWRAAIQSGFLIFSWWDLLKLGAAAMIYGQFARRWSTLPPEKR